MSLKTIKVSVTYDEDQTGQRHSISKTVKLDVPIGLVQQAIDNFHVEITGQTKLPVGENNSEPDSEVEEGGEQSGEEADELGDVADMKEFSDGPGLIQQA